MSLSFDWLTDPLYVTWLYRGVLTTIGLGVLGNVLMMLIGVAGSYCLHYRLPILSPLVSILVDLFRNTPPLVQLFILYFTLPDLGVTFGGGDTASLPIFNGFTCVVISLALYNGAIAVEIIRSGLEAVPTSTVEAARSLGYSRIQIFFQVQLPIGFRLSFSSMINNVVSVIKTSSQASLVAVGDIMFYANQISLETFMNLEVMIIVLALYLTIVSLAVFVAKLVEAKMKMYGYGK